MDELCSATPLEQILEAFTQIGATWKLLNVGKYYRFEANVWELANYSFNSTFDNLKDNLLRTYRVLNESIQNAASLGIHQAEKGMGL